MKESAACLLDAGKPAKRLKWFRLDGGDGRLTENRKNGTGKLSRFPWPATPGADRSGHTLRYPSTGRGELSLADRRRHNTLSLIRLQTGAATGSGKYRRSFRTGTVTGFVNRLCRMAGSGLPRPPRYGRTWRHIRQAGRYIGQPAS